MQFYTMDHGPRLSRSLHSEAKLEPSVDAQHRSSSRHDADEGRDASRQEFSHGLCPRSLLGSSAQNECREGWDDTPEYIEDGSRESRAQVEDFGAQEGKEDGQGHCY